MRMSFPFRKAVALPAVALLVSTVPSIASAGEWETSLTPYLWMAGLKGTVGAFPGLPPAEVDASFKDDILGNINLAFMMAAETRKDRVGLLMDLAYVDVEDSAALRGVIYDSASLQAKLWLFTFLGEYRLQESDQGFLDVVAGAKYISWENIIRLSNAGATRELSGKDDWFDLVVGIKGSHAFGDSPWFINGALLGGGFGIASDSLWDLSVSLGYQWTETFSTTLGYRYLDIDYEDDGFLVDLALDGAVIGFHWNW